MPPWSACGRRRSASPPRYRRASWRRRPVWSRRAVNSSGLTQIEFVQLIVGHDAMMRHEVRKPDRRHGRHATLWAWLSQSIARSSKETSPSARTARSGSPSSAPRRAGPSSGCTAPPAPAADPHRGAGLRGKGGHPADRHRPARDRIVDAVPVPERPRVHRRPAHDRGHAGNRQDGRGRTVRRRSLHAWPARRRCPIAWWPQASSAASPRPSATTRSAAA